MIIKEADYIFDFGPKAGVHGGKILAHGTYDSIKKPQISHRKIFKQKIKISTPKKEETHQKRIKIKKLSCIT